MRPYTKSDTHRRDAKNAERECYYRTTGAWEYGKRYSPTIQFLLRDAQDGEIVVALINNEEATVKRFFLRKDHIELRPENKAHPLMRYGFGEVLIQGKVIGVQRGPEQLS